MFIEFLFIIQPFIGNQLLSQFAPNTLNPQTKNWYRKLKKSSFTPPNYVFPIVWTILYILLGVNLIINYKNSGKKEFLVQYFIAYEIQLFLNFAWSLSFFGFKKPKVSLAIVTAMIGITGYLLWKSWKINKKAFWVLLPYGIWIAFAFYLNYSLI